MKNFKTELRSSRRQSGYEFPFASRLFTYTASYRSWRRLDYWSLSKVVPRMFSWSMEFSSWINIHSRIDSYLQLTWIFEFLIKWSIIIIKNSNSLETKIYFSELFKRFQGSLLWWRKSRYPDRSVKSFIDF